MWVILFWLNRREMPLLTRLMMIKTEVSLEGRLSIYTWSSMRWANAEIRETWWYPWWISISSSSFEAPVLEAHPGRYCMAFWPLHEIGMQTPLCFVYLAYSSSHDQYCCWWGQLNQVSFVERLDWCNLDELEMMAPQICYFLATDGEYSLH